MQIQQYIKDYTTLTKPKVNLLLVITALSAIFLASDNFPSIQVLIAVIIGGTLASGGAGAINHSIDKEIDNTSFRFLRGMERGRYSLFFMAVLYSFLNYSTIFLGLGAYVS